MQEELFFANKDIILKNNNFDFNFLAFSEMFNETYDYIEKWVLGLDMLVDEFDWQFHRSNLLTRFAKQELISYGDDFFIHNLNGLEKNNKDLFKFVRNKVIQWDNSIYFSRKGVYVPNKKHEIWDLWNCLKYYKEKNINNIKGNYNLLDVFDVTIARRKDGFYKELHAEIKDKEDLILIDEVREDLKKLLQKNKLDLCLEKVKQIGRSIKI